MPAEANPLPKATEHASFFFAFGCFGVLHFLIYTFSYGFPVLPSNVLAAVAGLALAAQPSSRIAFGVLVGTLLIDGILQAPVLSNHSMLKNFFVVGVTLAGVDAALRRRSWKEFVEGFAIVGRWLLLGMYFFGIFHKINTDFLNPASSCAVALWQQMPIPEILRNAELLHIAAIWGAFAFEALIAGCLLWPRARKLGIVLGIFFHALLALSGYAFYAPFSTITIALHCLFLAPHAHTSGLRNPQIARILQRLREPIGLIGVTVYLLLLGFLAWNGSYAQLGLAWLLIPTGLLYVLLHPHARDGQPPEDRSARRLLRPSWWSALLIAAFFFNGFAPYLGMKTAQSFNMFANLRLEAGQSNHLILQQPPGPFGYLADTVRVIEASDAPALQSIATRDLHLTWYAFLNHMEHASDDATVSFERDGEVHREMTRGMLRQEVEAALHPRWFRAWFHFAPVNLDSPKPCTRDN